MKNAEHFDTWIERKMRIVVLEDQVKALQHENRADEAFVKEWFRARPDRRRYRGVMYSKAPFTHFDRDKARALLGAKTKEVEETRYRETLSLDEQSKAVRDAAGAAAPLKPLRRSDRASA